MGAYALYAKPNDDFVGGATLSMTNPVTAYPASNMKTSDPAVVAKASATSTVITITGGSSVTIEGFCIFNHNLVGATVTLSNAAGYSQTITIPARASSGAVRNAWRDCRSDANRTSNVWTLTITGASANVQIGRLYLVTTWYEMPLQWDVAVEDERILAADPMETFYRSYVCYDALVNIRKVSGKTVDHTAYAQLYDLYHAAKGRYAPWPFILDYTVNDAMYVRFANAAFKYQRQAPSYTPVDIALQEVSSGPPP